MTAQTYISYELLLTAHGFKNPYSHRTDVSQPPNWEKKFCGRWDIQRVWLSHDGSFKAYRPDGNPICHGASVDELRGCFGAR